jgi:hypothetical protein
MAGRFLSLEEAARHLGVAIEDVNRLVDRKKLFPIRDGATVKFKLDDIDRVAHELGDDPAVDAGAQDLDLELSAPGFATGPGEDAGDDIILGEPDEVESIFDFSTEQAGDMPSRTIVRGPQTGGDDNLVIEDRGPISGARGPESAGDDVFATDDRGSVLDNADLELESLIGASSPSLLRGPESNAGGTRAGDGGTIALDAASLMNESFGGGRIDSSSGPPTGGIASNPLADSGLSLEDDDENIASGVDLPAPASGLQMPASGLQMPASGLQMPASGLQMPASGLQMPASGLQMSDVDFGGPMSTNTTSVVGGSGLDRHSVLDAFDLGEGPNDDESASVVIATEDTGDSSFFGAVGDDSGSVSLDDPTRTPVGVGGEETYGETKAAGPPFSGLQITGLVCCMLFLLTGGLVMIDLVWSIRAPVGEPVSQPLLKALGEVFTWR